ncbi:hypothetical protein DN069_23230 [Streptacidiphilus pinicola]|uniref:Proline racemase n=1 Tax=Streptacidiphilus pinicola TaxID=2219663 RepID=A0A2X0II88_9ACTN|nr:PrpF domain-containing protein [Streptacidiphilus pinicola]RAG83303.1 hypothetical protein DN069_23230 [Streptacidiphilus pinicola]
MIGHFAYAYGSPCPTVVLDARLLPEDDAELLAELTQVRRHLAAGGAAHVLKMALVRPAEHPLYDLDYRFVQALPQAPDAFDLKGSCGHSILSSTLAAERSGMLPRLNVGDRVRVNVLNNGDTVVCELDRVDREEHEFTVSFVWPDAPLLSGMLITGEPSSELEADGARREVSLFSAGNPYVFLDARALGIADADALFAAGEDFFDTLVGVRRAAAEQLGWPPAGAFPKVAVVLPTGPGQLAFRAVSVPSWHPTIALTGAACLAAAIRTPGTIPWRVARESGPTNGVVEINTPGSRTTVTAAVREEAGQPALHWVSVGRKRVAFQGSSWLEPLAHRRPVDISELLAVSTA